jgi:hypothetical protein
MEVGGQLHAREKSPGTNCIGDWVRPSSGLDVVAKNKIPSLPLTRTDPRSSSPQPSLYTDGVTPAPITIFVVRINKCALLRHDTEVVPKPNEKSNSYTCTAILHLQSQPPPIELPRCQYVSNIGADTKIVRVQTPDNAIRNENYDKPIMREITVSSLLIF